MKRYFEWLLNLFRWDGLLPVSMALIPQSIKLLFPHNDLIDVVTGVTLPIAAFFIRVAIGWRAVEGSRPYFWQSIVFLLAIVYLLFLDAMCILLTQLGAVVSIEDWTILARLYGVYLAVMAFATFPFQTEPASTPGVYEFDRFTEY